MVLFFVCCRILWFSLFIATFRFSISSADQALVDTICSSTSNRTLCLQVLDDSADADRASLGITAADAALEQVKLTRDLIYSLAKRARKPGEKGHYFDCLTLYYHVINSLLEYKTSIANKDFRSANIKASAALTDAEMCSDEGPATSPPNLPPQLKEANQKDNDYISIPLSVSDV